MNEKIGIIIKPKIESIKDGQWSVWSEWSLCDLYNNGHRQKYRICTVPQCGGQNCTSSGNELVTVNIDDEPRLKEIITSECALSELFFLFYLIFTFIKHFKITSNHCIYDNYYHHNYNN